MQKERIFHVISNTHWDREWRFPFQKNRQMLVDMIDKTLEILEKEPAYRAFHLDSQSVVLHDYLAVRPDKKDLIKKFVEEKRLLIGPWFILPDEFQVGGENMVRNLLLGHRICSEFGGASKIGYSPFSWGQISQLPQLYKEFGVDVIMFYRGVNSLDSEKAEFIWEGADGTRALTSRFSTMPRYNFYFYIYRPVVHNEGFGDVEYKWTKGGTPFHFADSSLYQEDYYITEPLDSYYKENIEKSVRSIIENQVNDFTTPHVIWMEGHDSSGPNIKTAQIIKDIKELMPDINVVHSTLEDYACSLKESADFDSLTLVKGERRSAQYDLRSGNLYGYTTSARMYLKQKNFDTERWLQFYAEPFNAFAGMLGLNIKDKYLDLAWYYLLENSAHDSIGGCSLDEIHDDMMSRYKQSIEISKGVFERACKHISKQIDLSAYPEKSIHLITLNPTAYKRNEVAEVFIDVPQDLDEGSIELEDQSGEKLAIQLIDKKNEEPVLEQMIDRPMYFKMKRYHCFIELKDIPSFGLKSLHVIPSKNRSSVRDKKIGKNSTGLPVLENANLKVRVNANGSLEVLDKNTKTRFSNIAYLLDEGEAGHAWVNKKVAPFISTLKAKPVISMTENGPLQASVTIKYELNLPKTLEDREKKTRNKVKMPVEVTATLKKDAKRIDISVKLNNTAESHRLRMMFPAGLDARYSYGEGQFDVVQRSVVRHDTSDWVEQPMYDYPMHNFVDVCDTENGCAVITDGLKEYEYINGKEKTLAVTLFRGFRFIIQPSSVQDYSYQKGSQCLGEQNFKLSFYPHKGDWTEGNVYREALCFNNPLSVFETGRTAGTLSPVTSLLEIEPKELIFSCLKKAEDEDEGSFVLRLYNPTELALKGKIKLLFPVEEASLVTLEEKYISSVELLSDNSFEITAGRKKIISIKLKMKK